MDEKLTLNDINALIEALDSWERENIQTIIKAGLSQVAQSKSEKSKNKSDYDINYSSQDNILVEKRTKSAQIRRKLLLLRKQIMKEV